MRLCRPRAARTPLVRRGRPMALRVRVMRKKDFAVGARVDIFALCVGCRLERVLGIGVSGFEDGL